jgi:glycosyltransferase involved in cell wall biosynthesis
MEILHCITTISMGGAEKQLLTLTREQVKLGLKVTILYLKDKPELKDEFERSGISIIDEIANKSVILQLIWLKKFLKSKSLIIHAHLSRSELLCALCKKNNYLVVTKHNAERFFPKSSFLISKILARLVFYKTDLCITISFAVQKYLEQIQEISKSNKTKVIHYGASPQINVSTQEIDSLKLSHGIKNELVIGTIARMVPQKNLNILVEAFAIYNKQNCNSVLILIGDGPLKLDLFLLSKDLNIEDKIRWIPRTNKIAQYLSIIDIFVLPSIYEGFGLVLLEAMQSGTAIAAAKNSAIPEVMGLDYPGLYPTNEPHKLFDIFVASEDLNFRSLLTMRYPERLSKFDSAIMAAKILEYYKAIL